MKIGRQFNTLTVKEYFFYIDNHKKYTDFNTLGLYRSLSENEKLTVTEKTEVRDYAHQLFKKSFDFLQLKDPVTYVDVSTLGQELTKGDKDRIWEDIRISQQKILKDKRIGHRNFGVYSKHNCGYDDCRFNGVMFKEGQVLLKDLSEMHLNGDKNRYLAKEKSKRLTKEGRQFKQKPLEEN